MGRSRCSDRVRVEVVVSPCQLLAPLLAPLLTHAPMTLAQPPRPQAFAERAKAAKAGAEPLATSIAQFYQTDAISRASKVMAKCIKVGAALVAGQRGSTGQQDSTAQQAQQGRGGRTDACECRAGAAPTGWQQCLALGRSATAACKRAPTQAHAAQHSWGLLHLLIPAAPPILLAGAAKPHPRPAPGVHRQLSALHRACPLSYYLLADGRRLGVAPPGRRAGSRAALRPASLAATPRPPLSFSAVVSAASPSCSSPSMLPQCAA